MVIIFKKEIEVFVTKSGVTMESIYVTKTVYLWHLTNLGENTDIHYVTYIGSVEAVRSYIVKTGLSADSNRSNHV